MSTLPHIDADNKPLILIAEDDEASQVLLRKTLSRTADLVVVDGGQEAVERAQRGDIDLILLDVMMPGMNGFEACRAIKASPRSNKIPVLFLTASHDIDEGFAAGGADFVRKPVRKRELLARIGQHLRHAQMLSALEATTSALDALQQDLQDRVDAQTKELRTEVERRRLLEERLRILVDRDALTNVWNRQSFHRQMKRDVLKPDHSLFAVKLHGLASLNDAHGFRVGDEVLALTADTITKVFDGFTVARISSSIFAVSVPLVSKSDMVSLAEECLQRLRAADLAAEPRYAATVVHSAQHANVRQLVRLAERSLAQAGDALDVVSEATEDSGTMGELARWAQRFDAVLADGGAKQKQQKIFTLAPNTPAVGREFWATIEVDGQWIRAGEFLPWAHRLGRTAALDLATLKSVLDFEPEGLLFANVAPLAIDDDTFRAEVLALLRARPTHAERLVIEFDEQDLATRFESTAAFARELKEHRVRIAIDHFGAGSTHYRYLEAIAADYVKLDARFTKGLADPTNRALVRSMVAIAHSHDIFTMALDVEREEALATLRELHVDYAQGYALHTPTMVR